MQSHFTVVTLLSVIFFNLAVPQLKVCKTAVNVSSANVKDPFQFLKVMPVSH